MSYYHKPKYYPQKVEGTPDVAITKNAIYKNTRYKQTKMSVICLEIAGMDNSVGFLLLSNCIRTNKEDVKFRSYEPTFNKLQFDYFKEGFFNATEEEKVMFGLIFNNLDAYTLCLDSFNEAEEFYASHAR